MVAEVEAIHDLVPTLGALLGFLGLWQTNRRARILEMQETIRRQEEEIKDLKEDNKRLGRDNVRLLERIAQLDHNGRH